MEYPEYLIVDVSWIKEHERTGHWVFQKLPVREIIEAFTKVPLQQSWEDAVWNLFQERFDEADLSERDIADADFVFEILVIEFYSRLRSNIGDMIDQYIFQQWVDPYSILFRLNR